jgi:hypothetical protein
MVKGQPTDKELDDFFASLPEFSGGKRKSGKKSAKKKSSPKKSGVKYCTATTRAGKYRQLYEGKCDKIKGSKMTARDLMKNKSGKIVSRKRSRHGSKQMKKNKHMMAAPYR